MHKLSENVGHACYYVEFPGGFRVLFDPVFSERCSPFSWLGPKRYSKIPCLIEDIPVIDAVIISHNHYDHLDHPTIMKIKAKHPHCHFFCPLGNKAWFLKSGIEQVTELDWWEERDINLSASEPVVSSTHQSTAQSSEKKPESIVARVGCLPCQHISARTGFDKGLALWASWSVESGGKKIWFGGDTGYRAVPELSTAHDYDPDYKHPHCPAFNDIGIFRGPFDLGLIPIGAYDPPYIMSPMHANPYDVSFRVIMLCSTDFLAGIMKGDLSDPRGIARSLHSLSFKSALINLENLEGEKADWENVQSVSIFKDTRCKRAIGIHHGVWVLTEEDISEPPLLLNTALAKSGIPTHMFGVCQIGESRCFD